jgi:hypothetical protein
LEDQALEVEDSPESEHHLKFLQIPYIVVDLSPGEVLYIPPYWLVRIEHTELSMSLDVKSLSREQVLLSEANALGVVLGNVSTDEEKLIAAQVTSYSHRFEIESSRFMLFTSSPEFRI